MKYDIYQVKDQHEAAREAGHQMFVGAKHFDPKHFGFYDRVCSVDGRYCGLANGDIDYTVSSLDEVFRILNGVYYNEDTDTDDVFESHVSGYTMKTVLNRNTKAVTEYRNMHSLSVGDIIAEVPQLGYETLDTEWIAQGTTYYMVDSHGFTDITDSLLDIDLAKQVLTNA